jgi:hypothetical protein
MARHAGASNYHDGSLKERTRRARRNRGRKIQSRKDKAAYVERAKEQTWL